MTLQKIPYATINYGKPSENMTDTEWQEAFEMLKATVKPSKHRRLSVRSTKNTVYHTYHGDTLDQTWRRTLNDILQQIRKGHYDFVYYIYNIAELLKYEHERLRSRYVQDGQYFEVWLDSSKFRKDSILHNHEKV